MWAAITVETMIQRMLRSVECTTSLVNSVRKKNNEPKLIVTQDPHETSGCYATSGFCNDESDDELGFLACASFINKTVTTSNIPIKLL